MCFQVHFGRLVWKQAATGNLEYSHYRYSHFEFLRAKGGGDDICILSGTWNKMKSGSVSQNAFLYSDSLKSKQITNQS